MAYPANKGQVGDYNALTSIYNDIARKPQEYGKVLKKFGKGLELLNFLHLNGSTIDVGSETIKIIEEGAPERPITVSIPTVAANTEVTITPSSADGSDLYIRSGFDILIPPANTGAALPKNMRVYYNGSAWKGRFYDTTTAITVALVSKEVIMAASSWGYGTDQPTGMTLGLYERTTNARIMKDTAGVEGGQIWQEDWESVEMENGSKGILSKLLTEMDFRLDSQIDAALFIAEQNDNSNLVAQSNFATGTKKIPSFDGLIPTMVKQGQPLTYSANFDMTKFESVKPLLESVGVTNREVDFLVGSDLNSNIETNMQSWLNTNSPGTELYDLIQKYVGFNVQTILKNSVKFNLVQLDSLSNPSKFGHADYPYRDMGFMFPKGVRNITIQPSGMESQVLKLPHLTLGYAVGKTENRRRWHNIHPGVNGIGQNIVANSYDGVKFYTGTHIIPIWAYMNQTILVTKTA